MLANVLTFATLAAAAAYPRNSASQGQYIDANYDDITVVPLVPAANTLGVYKGLNYTGFATNQAGVGGAAQVSGIAPHSSPNNIVSGFEQTDLTGANAGFSVADTKTSFDLLSFYYGCAVNTVEGGESLPNPCTFNVRGYRNINDANPIAQQQFSFTPKVTTALAQPMKATFNKDFQNIQRAELVQLESQTGEALNVLVLDDVYYDLHSSRQGWNGNGWNY